MAVEKTPEREGLTRARRMQQVKIGIGCLLVLALMYQGLQGRQYARVQAKLEDVSRVRNQLRQVLDEGRTLPDQLAGTNAAARQAKVDTPQARTLHNALQTLLREFYYKGKLSEPDDLELRLSQAVLANVEQRFAEGLTILRDEDEKNAAEGERRLAVRVLETRGDSFFGVGKFGEALKHYERGLALEPDRTPTMAQVAQCQAALGKRDEALSTYEKLATKHTELGHARLIQNRAAAAASHYEKAVEIQRKLIEEGRTELRDDLVRSHGDRGEALIFQGKTDAAITEIEKAIEILTQIGETKPHAHLTNELARSRHNRGNAFVSQGKWEAATEDFREAIKILTPVVEKGGQAALAVEMARNQNNLGVVHRAQGNVEEAMREFNQAIALVKPATSQSDGSSTAAQQGGARVRVTLSYSENALEALVRTQRGNRENDEAVVLAASLKNRGYAQYVQGKPEPALGDFKAAMDIYTKLVEVKKERDLALELARSLAPIAWIHATSPNDSLRNGARAKEYALKACDLSEWRSFAALEALAAADAETSNFAEAAKWQQKALELAPGKYKAEVRARLEMYQAGKAYRAAG